MHCTMGAKLCGNQIESRCLRSLRALGSGVLNSCTWRVPPSGGCTIGARRGLQRLDNFRGRVSAYPKLAGSNPAAPSPLESRPGSVAKDARRSNKIQARSCVGTDAAISDRSHTESCQPSKPGSATRQKRPLSQGPSLLWRDELSWRV